MLNNPGSLRAWRSILRKRALGAPPRFPVGDHLRKMSDVRPGSRLERQKARPDPGRCRQFPTGKLYYLANKGVIMPELTRESYEPLQPGHEIGSADLGLDGRERRVRIKAPKPLPIVREGLHRGRPHYRLKAPGEEDVLGCPALKVARQSEHRPMAPPLIGT